MAHPPKDIVSISRDVLHVQGTVTSRLHHGGHAGREVLGYREGLSHGGKVVGYGVIIQQVQGFLGTLLGTHGARRQRSRKP
jgi:hypothetical protein